MVSLSYDSVSIIPSYSDIENKDEISLTTQFSTNISLSIPIASSPHITDEKLAEAMAKHGGIGIIHKNCSIEEQSLMVRKVKSKVCYRIDHPYTVTKHHTFNYIRSMSEKLNISVFPIINPSTKSLDNVFDLREYDDFIFTDDSTIEYSSLNNCITVSEKIGFQDAYNQMKRDGCRYLVLVDDNKILKGMIFLKDLERIMKNKHSVDHKYRYICGAIVGISDAVERATKLIEEEVDVIVLDNAHAHHKKVFETLRLIKSLKGCPDVIVGDVYTTNAANEFIQSGADGIKVGSFPKNTTMMTGIDVQQLDSLLKCSSLGVPLIAEGDFDGLIGNMFKAIAIGRANCCMVNKMLLGTKESIGELVVKDGKKYKIYKTQHIPFKGFVHKVLDKMIDGLKMSMSYCGAKSLDTLSVEYTFRKDV